MKQDIDEIDEEELDEEVQIKPKLPAKKVESQKKLLVVDQLPTKLVNELIGDDGITYTVLTSTEAQAEMLLILRELKKGLL